jgi:hypothetical protein
MFSDSRMSGNPVDTGVNCDLSLLEALLKQRIKTKVTFFIYKSVG